jgi:hypothetical protein
LAGAVLALAGAAAAGPGAVWLNGTLAGPGDAHVYAVPLAEGSAYQFQLAAGNAPPAKIFRARLLNSSGDLVLQSPPITAGCAGGWTAIYSPPASGVYRLEVRCLARSGAYRGCVRAFP